MEGPLSRYRALIEGGALECDPAQLCAAERLQLLHDELKTARPAGLFRKASAPPRGVYMFGGVGRGKSMLMDLFFETAPVAEKRRVHFHEFMAEVHDRIAEWRGLSDKDRKRRAEFVKDAGDDPIRPVARRTAAEARLLCFDEFQVTDIADAMILGRLFEAMLAEGVTAVATSNRAPDDLYENGVNRQLFTPFIDLLTDRLDLIELDGETDYRLSRLAGAPVYHSPLNKAADAAMNAAWKRLTGGGAAHPETLAVKGRTLKVPYTSHGAARFEASALIAEALGPNDFLAIAKRYHTVFIDAIPALTPAKRNEAKRFVTLIDALYEYKVKLVCSAAAEPAALYPAGDGAFEFERTTSRLIEMQSEDYLALGHMTASAA